MSPSDGQDGSSRQSGEAEDNPEEYESDSNENGKYLLMKLNKNIYLIRKNLQEEYILTYYFREAQKMDWKISEEEALLHMLD